jgi:hypothetical protein
LGFGAGGGQGGLSILELNRIGLESGHCAEIDGPCWSSGNWPSWQAEMSKNHGDHLRIFNNSNDILGATVAMVVFSRVKTCLFLNWQINDPEEM